VNRPQALPAGLAAIYECPECEARYLGERRCPDCHLFTRRAGTGGYCPHCDEPVTIADLADSTAQPETGVIPMS
jgi:predicted amidophosphoribosyltransferase